MGPFVELLLNAVISGVLLAFFGVMFITEVLLAPIAGPACITRLAREGTGMSEHAAIVTGGLRGWDT